MEPGQCDPPAGATTSVRTQSARPCRRARPARVEDLSGLPAYVTVCEFDPLRDEGVEYATRLLHHGTPTELHVWPGTSHGSAGAVPESEISQRMLRNSSVCWTVHCRCDTGPRETEIITRSGQTDRIS